MRELEARFPDHLVVVGVHSAKYPAERDDRHLAAAVQRLELDHPVVNDGDFAIWQSYAVRAWPTLMFIDPRGMVIGKHEGEATADVLAPIVGQMRDEFAAAGLLSNAPAAHHALVRPQSALAFPGKVVASSDRLFISDTNRHRIVEARLDGQTVRTFGDGRSALRDGSDTHAAFNTPQGLALAGELLFVADTGNHAIRRIDVRDGRVTTLAGTGELAQGYSSGGPARETSLRSPWDVAVIGDVVYITMAGTHQLWTFRLGGDEVRRAVGSGHEGLRDGSIASAWLAQPSGIAIGQNGRTLVFTDSETSSVRVSDLPDRDEAQVRTLFGEGLFDFGDIDGDPQTARLQHPLGVAVDASSGAVYVADTYNNKIKRIDPVRRVIETWLGDGATGYADGAGRTARFFEPAGLGIAGGALYIADTNNHAIRRADLATGEVETVDIR